jgi:predicted deacetylase
MARLVVSLAGLTARPEALDRAADLAAALDQRGVPLSQLFRPHGAPDEVVGWLRERLAAGDTLALHGYDHTPDPTGARIGPGRRAEFAALPRHEAHLRLIAARRALTALGLRTDTFVPPRWLASAGTVEALAEQGFAVCADATGVRLLGPGEVLPGRVLGFRASSELRAAADDHRAAEAWRARVLLAELGRTVRRGGLVRLAVRAKDVERPARVGIALAAVDAALAAGAGPATYRGLAGAGRAA